ncbi:MAG: DNA-directed RNA polymerase subunit beta, partial [Alphaproteobacteria bacterium]|nr:DNA-directed RNA polymerase subunit beta [Alphaproteobacteria bacterium]
MAISFTDRKRMRKNFGRIREVAPMPNLIEVQLDSYKHFLQMDVAPEKRKPLGLQEVFRSVFPIKDFADRAELEFIKYELEAPKFDVEECQQRGVNFAAPLKVTLRLVVWDVDEETGARSIRDIKEQAVYMGDMPLMTDKGTFIINGTERVIVSQMHRSPGVFFDHDKGKTHSSGKFLFAARVIPYRGSWLDFEFDAKDHLYVRIDRRRKLPATTLLYALPSAASEAMLANEHDALNPPEIQGMSSEEILGHFYETQIFTRLAAPKSLGEGDELTLFNWKTKFVAERFRGNKLTYDLVDGQSFDVHAKMGEKLTQRMTQKLVADGLKDIAVPDEELMSRYVASDIINETTGEIFAEAGDEITPELLNILAEAGVSELKILVIDHVAVGPHLRNTLKIDRNQTREDALMDIYRLMRPGEPHTLLETAETLFKQLFFDLERYDLSSVGRVKMNARLGLDAPDTERVLRKADILAILKILCDLKDGRG